MNKKQKTVLWCCVITIVIILLYPPWRFALRRPPVITLFVDAGYSFVFSPPTPKVEAPRSFKEIAKQQASGKSSDYFHGYDKDEWIAEIKFNELIIPISIVLLIGLSLIFSLKSNLKKTS